jgi:3-dehydroquinate dehydratase
MSVIVVPFISLSGNPIVTIANSRFKGFAYASSGGIVKFVGNGSVTLDGVNVSDVTSGEQLTGSVVVCNTGGYTATVRIVNSITTSVLVFVNMCIL